MVYFERKGTPSKFATEGSMLIVITNNHPYMVIDLMWQTTTDNNVGIQ
jgi:hypothetical protein